MPGVSDKTFPEVEVDKELNPSRNNNFEVDSVSSQVATSLDIKERVESEEKEKEKERKDSMQTLKSAIIVSGVIVAVVGAVFAITRKLREK